MSYWDRLEKYRRHGPQAAAKFELRPLAEFKRLVGDLVDSQLHPLGWSRAKDLRWRRKSSQPWAEEVVEFQPLKSGIGIRWGLRLSFVPRLAGRELDFSYDPLDYQRDVTPWALSRFANDEELRAGAADLLRRVIPELESLKECIRDLCALASCFEAKKARKYARLGFHQYPQEGIAYATVLGLIGRQPQGLQVLAAVFDRLELSESERERLRQAVMDVWRKGPDDSALCAAPRS